MAGNRNCNPGRVLADREYIEEYVTIFLRRVGWENWIDAPERIHYPTYAKEFYRNINKIYRNNNPADPLLTSTVRGIPIHLSMNGISQIFNIPNEGECLYFPKKWKENVLQLSLAECQQTMLSSPDFYPGIIPTKMLKPEFKCLFTYVRANIVPVSGHNNEVSKFALFLMYCMFVGRKLNLPYIIINLMYSTKENGLKNFIYTSMLNKIFRHHNIVLDPSEETIGSTPIGKNTIKQFASHPVRDRTDAQSVRPNSSEEANEEEFPQHDTDIYTPMPPEEQTYYATQELNSNFDFVNPAEGSSDPHAASNSYAPANWSNWPGY